MAKKKTTPARPSRVMPDGKVRMQLDVYQQTRERLKMLAAKHGCAPNEIIKRLVDGAFHKEVSQ